MTNTRLVNFTKKYPWFKYCTIQTFDDSGEDRSLAKIIQIKQWWTQEVEELQKKGAWIFFSVNPDRDWETKECIKQMKKEL